MIGSAQGIWPTPGTSSMPPRPNWRNASDSAPVGAPPVHRRTAPYSTSIIPSVVMNDGTLRRVVTRPFTSPTARPNTSISISTPSVRDCSPSISLAAITTWAPTSEPTDRSNSPETMTKYWPAARITSGAAFLMNAISELGSAKLGFSAKIATKMSDEKQLRPLRCRRPRSARTMDVIARPPAPDRRRGGSGSRACRAGSAHGRASGRSGGGVDRHGGNDDQPTQHVLEERVDAASR